MAKNPDDIVSTLYGSCVKFRRAAAWCTYHHCHLTVAQIKTKGCLGKQCKCLRKLEHDYWLLRERRKELKKGGNKV